jgi:threonine dehydrogenase-like Zn-dependent dehydrogenase
MKAVAIDRFGPSSVLKLRRLPVPELGSREVLIALQGAGVGVWDADIRKGWWPKGRPKFPLILGSDGSGIVVAKGSRVRSFEVGDRVWAYEFINPKGGFYAQRVAVDTDQVGHVPRRMNLLRAGAATVTALTAFQGIKDVLKIRRGQIVLIFGATGAVGSLAIQFAKRRGARVLATAARLRCRGEPAPPRNPARSGREDAPTRADRSGLFSCSRGKGARKIGTRPCARAHCAQDSSGSSRRRIKAIGFAMKKRARRDCCGAYGPLVRNIFRGNPHVPM